MSIDESSNEISNEVFWKNLVVRYWPIVLIFGLLITGAIIGFILTLDWYVKTSALGGYGTWTFNDFSLGEGVAWFIFLLLWMLLLVVLPTLTVGGIVVAIVWFAVLPPNVKEEIRLIVKDKNKIMLLQILSKIIQNQYYSYREVTKGFLI